MNISKFCRLLILSSIAASTFTCANDKSEFLAAADQYCSLYSPSSWGDLAKSGDTYSIFNLIASKQETQIQNREFQELISNTDRSSFASFHFNLRENIKKITGKDWTCEDFDQFFMPTQKTISLSLGSIQRKRIDPYDKNTIVITITHSNEILIGNSPLKTNSEEIVTAGIRSRVRGRNVNELEFILYFDDGANGNLAPKIFSILKNIGVKKVDLIDF